MKIGVIGLGAVGMTLAARFSDLGEDVVGISRSPAFKESRESGIHLHSDRWGLIEAKPEVVDLFQGEMDLGFLTTKAVDATTYVDMAGCASRQESAVISLMNGVSYQEELRAQIGGRFASGAISIHAFKDGEHSVQQRGPLFRMVVSREHLEEEDCSRLERLCERAGIDLEFTNRDAEVIWGKLARLNALACATSLTGKTIGEIRSDTELKRQLLEFLREGLAVAKAEGVELKEEDEVSMLHRLPENQRSSLALDLEQGRLNELEVIPGGVTKVAARHGLACPALETALGKLRERVVKRSHVPS